MYIIPYKWLFEEDAQDLTEYTLLLAFVAMVTAALFLYNGSAVSGIWSVANSYLALGGHS
ncbi:MAG: Flp family type IVb pilin [Bryobacteraceae bacterium]|jgi:Flp pilus assembly pilin Flp